MEFNLTGQLWGMPANFSGEVTQGYWLQIITVVLGFVFTLFVNIVMERDKRRYELRRDAYSELLDTFLQVCRMWEEQEDLFGRLDILEQENGVAEHNTESEQEEIKREVIKKYTNSIYKFKLIASKIEICDGTKIKRIIDEDLSDLENLSDKEFAKSVFTDKLIPAIKEDLGSNKRWWQFWK